MKTNQKIENLEFIGMDNSIEFTIENSPMMMQILSDNIYQDNISALIRETATNAYDSHVEAGKKDVPFTIHLPNTFEPYYSIRDFGTGMSKKDIYDIYTTYGKSTDTKTLSNDYVGFMGIGSKSPYSYVSNFTVISYFDGVKTAYLCTKNESNIPTLFFLSEEFTTETNGLEISLQVKPGDFDIFRSKAEKIFKWFIIRPIPNRELFYEEMGTPDFESDGIKIFFKEFSQREEYVICGQVQYKLDFKKLEKSDLIKNYLSHGFYGNHFQLEMGIGEIDVDAARENVRYTYKTVKAVEKRFSSLKDKIFEEYNKILATTSGKWETNCILNTATKFFQEALKAFFGEKLYVGSIPIPKEIGCGKVMTRRRSGNKYLEWGHNYTGGYNRNVLCSPTTLFVILDVAKGFANNILEITKLAEFSHIKNVVVLKSAELSLLVDFVNEWGLVADKHYILFSNWKNKFPNNLTKRVPTNEYVYSFEFDGLNRIDQQRNTWYKSGSTIEEALEEEICYYIPMCKGYPIDNIFHSLNIIYENKIFLKDSLGFGGDTPIYILTATQLKKINKIEDHNFVNFLDFLKENANVLIDAFIEKKKAIGPKINPDDISKYWNYRIESLISIVDKIKLENISPVDNRLTDKLSEIKEIMKPDRKDDFSPINRIMRIFFDYAVIDELTYNMVVEPVPTIRTTIFDDLAEEFPILKLMSCINTGNIIYYNTNLAEFAKYLTPKE